MKHNQQNPAFEFHLAPVHFNRSTDRSLLQYCLGGTLYMPATKRIADKILARQIPGLTSLVMCLEDAIRADDVALAEENVLGELRRLSEAIESRNFHYDDLPLFFVRVRNQAQFTDFASRLDEATCSVLSGFVFPKFSSETASAFFRVLNDINVAHQTHMYGMPILEGRTIAFREERNQELARLVNQIKPFEDLTLNIRVGGTDLSSLFGVRRDVNTTVYDLLPVRDALADIVNFFSRCENDYTISGPVWEYFLAAKQDDLSDLVGQKLNRSILNQTAILDDAVDGLLRETLMDKANGFVGKTVIHPSHLPYVNALQSVTLEEYEDAKQILETDGGVIKSGHLNKMNEVNPHRCWAHRVTMRAKAYGVIQDASDYTKLFGRQG